MREPRTKAAWGSALSGQMSARSKGRCPSRLAVVALGMLSLAGTVRAASGPAGTWSGSLDLPYGKIAVALQLRQDGQGWQGQLRISVEDVEEELSSLSHLPGDVPLALDFETIEVRGEISGDGQAFEGLLKFPSGPESFVLALGREGSVVAKDLAEDVRQSLLDTVKRPLEPVPAERLRLPPPAPGSTVDAAALKRLLAEAEAAHSDAVVILKNGGLVGAWYAGGDVRRGEAYSVTKSVVNLAIGRLVALGKLEGLDQPVHRFFPEWRQGAKERITLRHLLAHTSGLEAGGSTAKIYASPDFVQYALVADLTHEPGATFHYNNKAVNLLPEIVSRASGKRMDLFLKDDLFAELGILDFAWELDRSGHPHGMAGFEVYPHDLARLGQLVLDEGHNETRTLIDPSWFDESLKAGSPHEPSCGLLWWLIPRGGPTYLVDDQRIEALRAAGASEETLKEVHEQVKGSYGSIEDYEAKMVKTFGGHWRDVLGAGLDTLGGTLWRAEFEEIVGYWARGDRGQYIIIFPGSGIVAVRMIRMWPGYNAQTDSFLGFGNLVWGLSKGENQGR